MNPRSTSSLGPLTGAACGLMGSIAMAMLLYRVIMTPAAAAALNPRAPPQVNQGLETTVFLLFFGPTIAAATLISGIGGTARRWTRALEIAAIGLMIAAVPFGVLTLIGIRLSGPLEQFEVRTWVRVAGQVFAFATPLLVCPFAAILGSKVGGLRGAA